MLPQEILKFGSSEITGNVYFSIYFCIFKVFNEGKQVTRKVAEKRNCKVDCGPFI